MTFSYPHLLKMMDSMKHPHVLKMMYSMKHPNVLKILYSIYSLKTTFQCLLNFLNLLLHLIKCSLQQWVVIIEKPLLHRRTRDTSCYLYLGGQLANIWAGYVSHCLVSQLFSFNDQLLAVWYRTLGSPQRCWGTHSQWNNCINEKYTVPKVVLIVCQPFQSRDMDRQLLTGWLLVISKFNALYNIIWY